MSIGREPVNLQVSRLQLLTPEAFDLSRHKAHGFWPIPTTLQAPMGSTYSALACWTRRALSAQGFSQTSETPSFATLSITRSPTSGGT